MISLVKREDYLSEEEYEEAYEDMLKAIKQHDIDNPEDGYDPNYEAAKALDLKTHKHIGECCNGKAKTAGEYKWKWK